MIDNEQNDKICSAMLAYLDTAGYVVVAIHPINVQGLDTEAIVETMENAGVYEIGLQNKAKEGIQ